MFVSQPVSVEIGSGFYHGLQRKRDVDNGWGGGGGSNAVRLLLGESQMCEVKLKGRVLREAVVCNFLGGKTVPAN